MKPEWMGIDCETTDDDWTTCVLHGFSVSYAEGDATYFMFDEVPESVKRDLANPEILKVGHNFHQFDGKVLIRAGFEVQGDIDDTMVIWNLCGEEKLKLKLLASKYIGPESLEKKRALDEYLKRYKCTHVGQLCALDLLDPNRPHREVISEYGCEDVLNTITLRQLGFKKLHQWDKYVKGKPFFFKKSPLDYYFEEARPLERVLMEIEMRGITVNMEEIAKVRDACKVRVDEYERKLTKIFRQRIDRVEADLVTKARESVTTDEAKARRVAGAETKSWCCKFYWSNHNHFSKLLYEYCDLPEELIFRTNKGNYQTDKVAIQNVIDGLPEDNRLKKLLLEYQAYSKELMMLNCYTGDDKSGLVAKLRNLDGKWKVYVEYRQTTGTGRLACSVFNMQNLKRDSDVKRFFIPETPGNVFDDFDYSQIELRDGCHLSKDPNMTYALNNGIDLHCKTASKWFGRTITKADDIERQAGKQGNFLLIFDGKEFRLQQEIKKNTKKEFTLEECAEFRRLWFEEYPDVRHYLNQQKAFFEKYGFCISEAGRIRLLPDIEYRHCIKIDQYGKKHFVGSQEQRVVLTKFIRSKGYTGPIDSWRLCNAAQRKYDHAVKAGYNQPIQGLAASKSKRSMIKLHRANIIIRNQVHDSIVVERRPEALEIKQFVHQTMKNIYPLRVPIEVDCKTLKSFHPKDKAA